MHLDLFPEKTIKAVEENYKFFYNILTTIKKIKNSLKIFPNFINKILEGCSELSQLLVDKLLPVFLVFTKIQLFVKVINQRARNSHMNRGVVALARYIQQWINKK
jgi:hypothetical protein